MWYRSLYWRIAFGFVALLATLLLVQALLFLWVTGEAESWLPLRSPFRLARLVASDLAEALTRNPDLELQPYVREQFPQVYQPFVVVMADGRVAQSREGRLPPGIVRAARERLGVPARYPNEGPRGGGEGGRRSGPGFRPGETPPSEGTRRGAEAGPPRPSTEPPRPSTEAPRPSTEAPRPGGEEAGRGGTVTPRAGGDTMGRSGAEPPSRFGRGDGASRFPAGGRPPDDLLNDSAPIVINGARVGLVVLATRGPQLFFLLRQFGPTLAAVGVALLIIGAGVGSLVIFRPARERMRKLEEAAVALGAGRTSVRAPDQGADEVSALARAFNRMAATLEASDAARRRLLADVSHELRTPLTAIRGYVETLDMPEVALDDETRSRYLRIVGEETEKLEAIVGDLLDVSRLEGGGGTLNLQAVPVARLFARVGDRHEHEFVEKHIAFEAEVAPDAREVWGDPGRLEQALQNLAANAVRHTPEGGRIVLRAESAGDQVRLSVRDSGPGIPAEHLPHVFDRFYKADAARRGESATGSGLGLSIVKAIVQRHGGQVAASNAEGGGAVFELLLPRSPNAVPAPGPGIPG